MLYLVPTPIGNLKDITLRALEVLKEVDLIYAEDTRVSSKLLKHYAIDKKSFSFHAHNEHNVLDKVIEQLKLGQSAAYMSDAGTPGISDPGYLLVSECIKEDLKFTVLPGATSIIPAIVGSGFPCERFYYEGFLPHKKGREKKLKEILTHSCTSILLESPHRIVKALKQIDQLSETPRKLVVAREISKLYEEFLRGSPTELISHFEKHPPKGEMVLMIEGTT